jgi:hypothetical protein
MGVSINRPKADSNRQSLNKKGGKRNITYDNIHKSVKLFILSHGLSYIRPLSQGKLFEEKELYLN